MNREILRIALPNIVSNITVPLMGIVSTAIAGHWGDDSAAAIGALAIGVSIFNFIYWNCSFVRMGTSGLTAQAFGAGRFGECANMLARALAAAGAMGLLMVALQYPVGELALWAMHGGEMTRDYFYARIWAVPAGILLFGFNGWYTGMQNAVFPMCTAITVNVVHTLCSLWFAFGMDLGIVGIAYASVVAQWTGVALASVLLVAKYRPVLRLIDWSQVLDLRPLKAYFSMVHGYGARTMMHMCGCVRAFLPRLIELGLDVYDVVQPTVPQMDIEVLQKDFGDKINFCGSVCVQSTLAFGTVDDVVREVERRKRLFPEGGLFLGPSHAIQVGTPLENILAMYRTAGSLTEEVDDSILAISEGRDATTINMSKLF